jgi:ATP-dependent RNA helicase RhlE
MPFAKLRLSPLILRALEQEGYTTPTPIQAEAIPHIMNGRDVLGSAQTGTGKTAAFALPILHRLSTAAIDKTRRGPRKARAIVLSPTRELAVQIAESFACYGRGTALDYVCIYGGVSQRPQEKALHRGVDVIIATPGRLMDLMEQGLVDLSAIEVLVLDEADRMLDMGFIQPIRQIAAQTPAATRQTLLFSATMPKAIVQLAHSLLRDPVKIAVNPVSSAVPLIEQALYMVGRGDKQALLQHLLLDPASNMTKALVFTRTKHGADRVARKLHHAGIRAETIHGDKPQNARRRALALFTSGAAPVLVATDVAARGLDVDDISHVINFDLPVEAEAYVHRIGRTGRAGATGIAISFCDNEERGILRDIERLTAKRIPIREAVGVKPVAPIPYDTARPQPSGGGGGAVPGGRPFRPHAKGHAPAGSGRTRRPWTNKPTGGGGHSRGGHGGKPAGRHRAAR